VHRRGLAHKRSPVIVAMADGRVVDAMEGMDGTVRLTVRTARDGDRALVEIGDNGPVAPSGL
jgi:hypothetical protein